jgi:hypothetical protein
VPGPTADGALELTLLPDDRALALPVDWDGGGELALHADLNVHGTWSSKAFMPPGFDWSVFPARVVLTLSYVPHAGQWRLALDDLGGKRLHQPLSARRSACPPAATPSG